MVGIIPISGRGEKSPKEVSIPELTKAKDIAFSNITVKGMLKGKNYSVEPVGVWHPENIAAFQVHFDKSYKDEYTLISKGESQSAVIQATGIAIAVDLGTKKVVDMSPIVG